MAGAAGAPPPSAPGAGAPMSGPPPIPTPPADGRFGITNTGTGAATAGEFGWLGFRNEIFHRIFTGASITFAELSFMS